MQADANMIIQFRCSNGFDWLGIPSQSSLHVLGCQADICLAQLTGVLTHNQSECAVEKASNKDSFSNKHRSISRHPAYDFICSDLPAFVQRILYMQRLAIVAAA